jgi:hypothetical protein
MIPVVAGGDWIDDLNTGTTTTSSRPRYQTISSLGNLKDALSDIGNWTVKTFPEILMDLSSAGYMIASNFWPEIQNSLYALEQAGVGSVADLSQTPGIAEAVTKIIKSGGAPPPGTSGYGSGGGGGGDGGAADRAFAAAEREKDRAFQAEQDRLQREARERESRLSALLDNLRYANEIQPDLARSHVGLNSIPLQGTTPTIAYGNAIQSNISQLKGQLANPPPVGTPIPTVAPMSGPATVPLGMREGGAMEMGMTGVVPKFGSSKTAVLVGEERSGIDGSAEVAIMDKQTGQLQEIIPLMGGAAEGASFNFADYGMTQPKSDFSSLYGALNPLYQPFNITSGSAIPMTGNATPTSLGYISPKYSTDMSPTQPPAYGPLSQQFFYEGRLLPNPSSILKELRVLRDTNPQAYVDAMSFYAFSTTADGKASGLAPAMIDSMINNASLKGRTSGTLVGIR